MNELLFLALGIIYGMGLGYFLFDSFKPHLGTIIGAIIWPILIPFLQLLKILIRNPQTRRNITDKWYRFTKRVGI